MPKLFVLDIETHPTENKANFILSDEQGVHLATRQVHITRENAKQWAALFNTRTHVELETNHLGSDSRTPTAIIATLSEFLEHEVLGPEISAQLQGIQRRTLLIRLPDTRFDELAAAFARVPWEMAFFSSDSTHLLARNLTIRIITAANRLPSKKKMPLALADGEVLRVLLIFAEPPGTRPLAMRLEREHLLHLFYQSVLPQRLVQVDVLCYGVTREAIAEQVRKAKGYHFVHWSGHGHHDRLELLGKDGKPDRLHGEELVELFVKVGGFIPKFIFLNACHLDLFIHATNWESWCETVKHTPSTSKDMNDERPKAKFSEEREISDLSQLIAEKPGDTGTAIALLRAGVLQIIAMRYEVDDVYARRLAERFYRYLLVEQHSTDSALALARSRLANDATMPAIDHSAPLLFGTDNLSIEPHQKCNTAQLTKRFPRPSQPLLQHDLKQLKTFVGRSQELTRLNQEWLPPQCPAVALLEGLAGLGKTALAAEALHLWHNRFDYVLAVQARYHPLTAAAFYQEVDRLLTAASKDYRKTCQADEYRQLWLPTAKLTDTERYQLMRDNIINIMYDKNILLIIDNFETNLLPPTSGLESSNGVQSEALSHIKSDGVLRCALSHIKSKEGQERTYDCQDVEWHNLLEAFCTRLSDSSSRVLITCRHRPAALKDNAVWLPLKPLPLLEAKVFLQNHENLSQLWHHKATHDLAIRVLEISRGHPFIMLLNGNLAKDAEVLATTLERLEQPGFEHLPDLVNGAITDEERETESRYLFNVLIRTVDVLIERLSLEARQLLWVVTRTLEPASYPVLAEVWESSAATVPLMAPLLKELTSAGLMQQESHPFEQSVFSFHELVRECCTAWMDKHPQECGEFDAQQIWQADFERKEING